MAAAACWARCCCRCSRSPRFGGTGASDGKLFGMLGLQALAVLVTLVWSAVATVLIAWLLGFVTPLRVGAEEEYSGLDLATHGERAYENA